MAYELKEFMIEKYLSRFESVGCKSPMMNHNGWCHFKNKCAVRSIPTAGVWEAFVMNLWWTVGWQIEKHEYCKHLHRFTYKLTHLICSLKANRFKWLFLSLSAEMYFACRSDFEKCLVKRCMYCMFLNIIASVHNIYIKNAEYYLVQHMVTSRSMQTHAHTATKLPLLTKIIIAWFYSKKLLGLSSNI